MSERTTRLTLHEPKPNPRLSELIEKTRQHKMTPEEISAQRRSWVIGEMVLEHESMTRQEAEAIYDNVLKANGWL